MVQDRLIPWSDLLRQSAHDGLFLGVIAGFYWAWQTGQVNPPLPSWGSAVVYLLYFQMLFVTLCLGLSAVSGLVLSLLSWIRPALFGGGRRPLLQTSATITLYVSFLVMARENVMQTYPNDFALVQGYWTLRTAHYLKVFLVLFGAAAAGILTTIGLSKLGARKLTLSVLGIIVVGQLPLAAALLRLIPSSYPVTVPSRSLTRPETPSGQVSRNPMILFAIDGAEPWVLDRMVREGKLRTLSELKQQGSWGDLRTLPTSLTHIVFPAVATGTRPGRNGLDFSTAFRFAGLGAKVGMPISRGLSGTFLMYSRVLPGLIQPTFSNMSDLRTKTFWEIISEETSLRQEIMSWPVVWPAQNLGGLSMVTGEAYSKTLRAIENESNPELVVGLNSEYQPLEHYLELGTLTLARDISNEDKKILGKDRFTANLALKSLSNEQPDLLALYMKSVDSSQHRYWSVLQPEYYSALADADRQRGLERIESAYIFADETLAALKARAHEATNFMIFSDHGSEAVLKSPFAAYGQHYTGHHYSLLRSVDGVLILHGPAFRQGSCSSGSVLDIAPTVLYLMGVAVPRDMDGRVLEECLAASFLRQNPVTYVESYGSRSRELGVGQDEDPETIQDRIKEFKALGYIN